MTINLDELLEAMKKYRDLYWRLREVELQGYLEHYQRRESDLDDEDDFNVDEHNRMLDLYSEKNRAELELMNLIQGEPTEEVARLYKALEPYG